MNAPKKRAMDWRTTDCLKGESRGKDIKDIVEIRNRLIERKPGLKIEVERKLSMSSRSRIFMIH